MKRIVQLFANSVSIVAGKAGRCATLGVALCLLCCALQGCSIHSEDSDSEPPTEFPETPHGRVSIAHLKALCTADRVVITDDIAIEGYIFANDLYGEFTKTIFIADESGCIEIRVDCDSTAEIFFIGARLVVECSSLALGDYGGRIILGSAESDEYSVGRIAERDFGRYFLIDTSQPKEVKPTVVKITDISTSQIGNYVEIRDVYFTDGGTATWCDKDEESGDYITTERTISDSAGNEFSVRTAAECTYRNETLPQGYCTLRGILEYFNGHYSLRIVNHQIISKE